MNWRALFLLLVFLYSCAVPQDIPDPNGFKYRVKGAKIYLTLKSSNKKKIEGEIISYENRKICVLGDKIEVIDIDDVKGGYIVLARLANADFDGVDAIGVLALSHGWWSIITIWVNIASIRSVKKADYRMKIGLNVYLDDIHKFARFPQGFPPGLSLDRIK